jgi:HEAT repeat protein
MDSVFNNSEDAEIHQLIEKLYSEDGMERQKARKALVAKGKDMIDFLMELLNHQKYIYRWEALKTMEEIGDPAAIPLFIRALEDDKVDVRWIAERGLIKLGMLSVKPLLKVLIRKSDSVFILAGAHHIFYDLRENGVTPTDFAVDKLLSALKNTTKVDSIIPMASGLLNKLELLAE